MAPKILCDKTILLLLLESRLLARENNYNNIIVLHVAANLQSYTHNTPSCTAVLISSIKPLIKEEGLEMEDTSNYIRDTPGFNRDYASNVE